MTSRDATKYNKTLLGALVQKLCGRSRGYALAYSHPGSHRTSNMLDRVMRSMNRYFEDAQHLHGSQEAGALHCRAWALLYNYRPWHPVAARANQGWRFPCLCGIRPVKPSTTSAKPSWSLPESDRRRLSSS
jgi:hypothetical protein